MSNEIKKGKKETEKSEKSEALAVIRVRGLIGIKKSIKDTLSMLRLYRKNYCIVIDKTPSTIGMIKKVKDYVTYGEISKEVYDELVKKRGEKTKNKEGKEVLKKFFRLSPPEKGFGRKGIKMPFNQKGALGYRGDKINDLIKRML